MRTGLAGWATGERSRFRRSDLERERDERERERECDEREPDFAFFSSLPSFSALRRARSFDLGRSFVLDLTLLALLRERSRLSRRSRSLLDELELELDELDDELDELDRESESDELSDELDVRTQKKKRRFSEVKMRTATQTYARPKPKTFRIFYLPLLDETDPRRLLSRPRRLFSLSLSADGDSDRIRLALYERHRHEMHGKIDEPLGI